MTLPTYKIEVAFNAGVSTPAASRVWTDITAYVLLDAGLDIPSYGRGDWRSAADANTLKLTLNNSDGRFTAGRAASPYYPNVKLGRPIRVTATVGGVSSVRYVGFVDEWPTDWPATVSSFATAQVSAASRLAWMAEGAELRSVVEEEILIDNPVALYTLGEPQGSTSAADTSGSTQQQGALAITRYAPGGPGVTFGTSDGATFSGGTSQSTAAFLQGSVTIPVTASTVVMELVATLQTSASGCPLVAISDGRYSLEIWASSDLLSIFTWLYDYQTGVMLTEAFSPSGASPISAGPHHIAASYVVSTGVLDIYLDGALVTAGGVAAYSQPFTATGMRIGSGYGLGKEVDKGTVKNVAVWTTSTSPAARIAVHAAAGTTGFAGETPASRITRYASYADIAATELSLDTGQVAGLMNIDTTGSDALDMMRKIEETEEGILFDRADGLLAFHDRAHRYTAASSFTLDVAQGHVAPGLSPRLDRATIRNDVTATNSDGTLTARAANQASIDAYGLAREALDVATSNADEPFEHASWLVNQYAEPQPRVPQLMVNLNNLPTALTQAILATGVSTRFTVKSMPTQAATTSQDYFVEGYSESIGEARHSITFNLSQAQPYDVFTIGDPVLGQYDAYPIAL
jgi:hypothetical protein